MKIRRQCVLCGRKGSRLFVRVKGGKPRGTLDGVMCRRMKACNRRRGAGFSV